MAQILPSTTAPFAPRPSKVILAMGPDDDPWLKKTLKQFKTKPPLRTFQQRKERLTDILSSNNAIWTLASIMVPSSKLSGLQTAGDPPFQTGEILHVEGHINHIDMVTHKSVVFKLTDDSIKSFIAYYKDVQTTGDGDWKETEQLHQEFRLAINKFVCRTPLSVMEMLGVDGSGELPRAETEVVKTSILRLMERPKTPSSCAWQASPHVPSISPLSSDIPVRVYDLPMSLYHNSFGTMANRNSLLDNAAAFDFAPLSPCFTVWEALKPSQTEAQMMFFLPTDIFQW